MPSAQLVTPLAYALLCEIGREARGGYVLRRLFETTPLGIFSSSPGSVYPALRRLEARGLIQSVGAGRGGRFEITARGRSILEAWLALPVDGGELSRGSEMCLLRFAFLDQHPDPALPARFLESMVGVAMAREAELAAYLGSVDAAALTRHGRLAVEHGVRSIQATRQWAQDALHRVGVESSGASS